MSKCRLTPISLQRIPAKRTLCRQFFAAYPTMLRGPAIRKSRSFHCLRRVSRFVPPPFGCTPRSLNGIRAKTTATGVTQSERHSRQDHRYRRGTTRKPDAPPADADGAFAIQPTRVSAVGTQPNFDRMCRSFLTVNGKWRPRIACPPDHSLVFHPPHHADPLDGARRWRRGGDVGGNERQLARGPHYWMHSREVLRTRHSQSTSSRGALPSQADARRTSRPPHATSDWPAPASASSLDWSDPLQRRRYQSVMRLAVRASAHGRL